MIAGAQQMHRIAQSMPAPAQTSAAARASRLRHGACGTKACPAAWLRYASAAPERNAAASKVSADAAVIQPGSGEG
jgi:hypothetical protein